MGTYNTHMHVCLLYPGSEVMDRYKIVEREKGREGKIIILHQNGTLVEKWHPN